MRDPARAAIGGSSPGAGVQAGLLRNGEAMDALLRLMHGLYVPLATANTSWPDTVRKDFTGQVRANAWLIEL